MKQFLLCICLSMATVPTVQADEYRPAYLELKQTNQDTFEMLWKVPALGSGKRMNVSVRLPGDAQMLSPASSVYVRGAFIEKSTVRRPGGLAGAEIYIEGLNAVSTEALVRIERSDGSTEVARLTPSSPSFVVTRAPKFEEVVKTYLVFGVQHILQGLDHLLFVACLILIAGTWHRILITITGFTIAHSITLTLSALELVQLPVPPIEVAIALSIVFLAREIAVNRRDTLTWRYPIAVSSTFGLLHGFGFASALREIGLPQGEIPTALLSFNIGVEIGQIAFVCGVLMLVWIISVGLRQAGAHDSVRVAPMDWLRRIEKPLAYAAGAVTVMWTLQRIGSFWAY